SRNKRQPAASAIAYIVPSVAPYAVLSVCLSSPLGACLRALSVGVRPSHALCSVSCDGEVDCPTLYVLPTKSVGCPLLPAGSATLGTADVLVGCLGVCLRAYGRAAYHRPTNALPSPTIAAYRLIIGA